MKLIILLLCIAIVLLAACLVLLVVQGRRLRKMCEAIFLPSYLKRVL